MTGLEPYGWNASLAQQFSSKYGENCKPGRVILQQSTFAVITVDGLRTCSLAGRLKYLAGGAEDLPVIGDWVAVDSTDAPGSGRIVDVLPRTSCFIRKVPGERTVAQVIAANIDFVLLVSGLDGEFNPARIERYMVLARESRAEPILVLNKADLCTDIESVLVLAAEAAPGIRSIPMSAKTGEGFEELATCVREGVTCALLGSSGVGKSSIVNLFLGSERMKVMEVRASDSRGRHATTHRELILLPSGGMLIDTPGMRELQLWSESTGMEGAFEDIETLALECKFTDCRHEAEPGCAVLAALDGGTLDAARFESYRKLQRELQHLQGKHDIRARILAKREAKRISAAQRRWDKRDQ